MRSAFCFFATFLFVSQNVLAKSFIINSRVEAIQSEKLDLGRRILLKSIGSAQWGPYSFYLEGFIENEWLDKERERRVLHSPQGELQELYIELKLDPFYIKVGKHSLRWSDMWVRPSLDVWTARRWNRFLYDPLPEQLSHSSGMTLTYVKEKFNIEGIIVENVARDEYPSPLPQYLDERDQQQVSGGLKLAIDHQGLGLKIIGAKHNLKSTHGAAVSYASEQFVSKMELGEIYDHSTQPLTRDKDKFISLGFDYFGADFTLQPQATWFDFGDGSRGPRDFQTILYLSGTWTLAQSEYQLQTMYNTATLDQFLNLSYSYDFRDSLRTTFYYQKFRGDLGSLFQQIEILTGEWIAGVRVEFNTDLFSR